MTKKTTPTKCKCGSIFVVNKKYSLCERCNYIRIHGQSKQQVYEQRRKHSGPDTARDTSTKRRVLKKFTKQSSISHISKRNTYLCSSGERVTKVEINTNYQRTCEQIKLEREPICQGTGRTDLPLSFSHTISRDRCQKIGKTELIWDKDNIEVESYEPPCSFPTAAHNIWEVGSLEMKKTLINFTRKLEYIKKHDPQLYQRFL